MIGIALSAAAAALQPAPPNLSICELMAHPSHWRGRTIVLEGHVETILHHGTGIWDMGCRRSASLYWDPDKVGGKPYLDLLESTRLGRCRVIYIGRVTGRLRWIRDKPAFWSFEADSFEALTEASRDCS